MQHIFSNFRVPLRKDHTLSHNRRMNFVPLESITYYLYRLSQDRWNIK